jgi:catalase
MNRSHIRYRQINPPDPGMFWDFHVNNSEGINALMRLFWAAWYTCLFQHINAFSVHTYTLSKEVRNSIGRVIPS